MASTVIGVFRDESDVQRVMDDLANSGFARRDINRHDKAGSGLRTWLENQGVPTTEADDYIAGVKNGGKLVAIEVDDDRTSEAVSIMERHQYDGVAYGTAAGTDPARARAAGTKDTARTGMSGDVRRTDETTDRGARTTTETTRGEKTIPVTEETLEVGKREVERGGVRVKSYVTEQPVEKDVRVRDETINVDRRPVDRAVGRGEADAAFREQSIEMTETDEEVYVDKRARVVEEVVLSKDVQERTEKVRDTVRKTEVEVEGAEDVKARRTAFDKERDHYRTHHRDHLKESAYGYDDYEPAYRYGVDLASHPDYGGKNWKDVEPTAREHWERQNPDTWREFEPAIRYGYERGARR